MPTLRIPSKNKWKNAKHFGVYFEKIPSVLVSRPSSSKNNAGTLKVHFWGSVPNKCWIRGRLIPLDDKVTGKKQTPIKNAVLRRCGGNQVIAFSPKARAMLLSNEILIFKPTEISI